MRRLFVPILLPSLLLCGAGLVRAEIVERVVAKVNGQIITLSDFETRQVEAAQAARVGPDQVGAFLRQNNAKILQQAIDDVLLQQKAEDAGIKAPPQYVDEVIESIKKDHKITSQQEFETALEREGLTLGELRKNIENSITQRMVVQREIEPKIAVSEAELLAEYQKLRDTDFTKPPTVTLQEILVKDDASGEAFAQQLVAKARAGEDFQALAKANSAAPSRANGGDIGEIATTDMDPQLRKLALSLPVGGVSDPIRVEGGYRIVKVIARTAGSTTPYEAAKEKIRERLMMSRADKEYEAYMQDLRKTAQIELRVREVPLQLTGPIPEGSLLEGLEGAGLGASPSTPAAPPARRPSAPPAQPAPAASGGATGGDEISTTPQAAPEHVAPPAAPGADKPKETPPPAP